MLRVMPPSGIPLKKRRKAMSSRPGAPKRSSGGSGSSAPSASAVAARRGVGAYRYAGLKGSAGVPATTSSGRTVSSSRVAAARRSPGPLGGPVRSRPLRVGEQVFVPSSLQRGSFEPGGGGDRFDRASRAWGRGDVTQRRVGGVMMVLPGRLEAPDVGGGARAVSRARRRIREARSGSSRVVRGSGSGPAGVSADLAAHRARVAARAAGPAGGRHEAKGRSERVGRRAAVREARGSVGLQGRRAAKRVDRAQAARHRRRLVRGDVSAVTGAMVAQRRGRRVADEVRKDRRNPRFGYGDPPKGGGGRRKKGSSGGTPLLPGLAEGLRAAAGKARSAGTSVAGTLTRAHAKGERRYNREIAKRAAANPNKRVFFTGQEGREQDARSMKARSRALASGEQIPNPAVSRLAAMEGKAPPKSMEKFYPRAYAEQSWRANARSQGLEHDPVPEMVLGGGPGALVGKGLARVGAKAGGKLLGKLAGRRAAKGAGKRAPKRGPHRETVSPTERRVTGDEPHPGSTIRERPPRRAHKETVSRKEREITGDGPRTRRTSRSQRARSKADQHPRRRPGEPKLPRDRHGRLQVDIPDRPSLRNPGRIDRTVRVKTKDGRRLKVTPREFRAEGRKRVLRERARAVKGHVSRNRRPYSIGGMFTGGLLGGMGLGELEGAGAASRAGQQRRQGAGQPSITAQLAAAAQQLRGGLTDAGQRVVAAAQQGAAQQGGRDQVQDPAVRAALPEGVPLPSYVATGERGEGPVNLDPAALTRQQRRRLGEVILNRRDQLRAGGTERVVGAGEEGEFVNEVSRRTGLDPRTVMAWTRAEGGNRFGDWNRLNIGQGDSGPYGPALEADRWSTPREAAKWTAEFLKGNYAGPSQSIAGILDAARGKSPSEQLQVIANTDWASNRQYNQLLQGVLSGLDVETQAANRGDRTKQRARLGELRDAGRMAGIYRKGKGRTIDWSDPSSSRFVRVAKDVLPQDELHKWIVPSGSGSGQRENIDNLNPVLARQLVQIAKESGRPITMNSGQRSSEYQANIDSGTNPKAPPGLSAHQFGMAADTDMDAEQAEIARKYGVIHGQAGPGVHDPPHSELATPELIQEANKYGPVRTGYGAPGVEESVGDLQSWEGGNQVDTAPMSLMDRLKAERYGGVSDGYGSAYGNESGPGMLGAGGGSSTLASVASAGGGGQVGGGGGGGGGMSDADRREEVLELLASVGLGIRPEDRPDGPVTPTTLEASLSDLKRKYSRR